jgi:EAL domain-containing protein (putative c-di-GMP-specific phosphodiesterase class I)
VSPDGGRAPRVHVNVSVRQLDRGSLSELVRDTLLSTGLPAEQLVIELTETHLEHVHDAVRAELAALHAMGVGVAADDFGTGYSALSRLTELPLDMLKIDRSFVAHVLDDPRSAAVVATIVSLSAALGLDLVAEGVETIEQRDRLLELGCRDAQGYWWSHPVEPDAFTALLADRSTSTVPTALVG